MKYLSFSACGGQGSRRGEEFARSENSSGRKEGVPATGERGQAADHRGANTSTTTG